ncbi:hypothetical protein Tco_1124343 [Tanacetum coccineum]|uniref:Reverse transcriptase domain-containing protein n=1 Tax=Tanacetum coccineum TaxID=301880 RepID=A0ABQ5J5X9_9ASTR
MVYVVNGVLASSVDMVLEKDFAGFALQEMKIHPLMFLIQTLSMISQTFSPTLHNPSTNHTHASYVGTILTTESTIPLNEIVSQIPPSIAITPVLPTVEPDDSLSMGDEHLNTTLEKESDEFIKSSVEDLVPIPSESEDTSDSDRKFKIYVVPLFLKIDDEYIFSDVNPLFDEVLEDTESKDSYVSKLDEPDLLVTPLSKLNEDECFDSFGDFILEEIEACLISDSIPPGIDNDDFDPEGDILLLEKLLNNDLSSPLPPERI